MPTENNGRPGLELFPKQVRRRIRLTAIEFGVLTAVITYYMTKNLIATIVVGSIVTIVTFIACALEADQRRETNEHYGLVGRYSLEISLGIGCGAGALVNIIRDSSGETNFMIGVVFVSTSVATFSIIDLWRRHR